MRITSSGVLYYPQVNYLVIQPKVTRLSSMKLSYGFTKIRSRSVSFLSYTLIKLLTNRGGCIVSVSKNCVYTYVYIGKQNPIRSVLTRRRGRLSCQSISCSHSLRSDRSSDVLAAIQCDRGEQR